MLIGRVAVFFVDNSRQYGFLNAGGTKVYFHANTHHTVLPGMIAPTFGKQSRPISTPKPGDEVMFEAIHGRRGLKAKRWCFKSEADQAIQEAVAAKD